MGALLNEAERIQAEYARRRQQMPADAYAFSRPHNLFIYQQKCRELLKLLVAEGVTPLGEKTILDVGCGDGQHLLDFLSWGAVAGNMAGIDLIESRVAVARARLGDRATRGESGPDLRS